MKVAGCCNGGCCAAANELLFPGAASSAARPTPFSLSLSLSPPNGGEPASPSTAVWQNKGGPQGSSGATAVSTTAVVRFIDIYKRGIERPHPSSALGRPTPRPCGEALRAHPPLRWQKAVVGGGGGRQWWVAAAERGNIPRRRGTQCSTRRGPFATPDLKDQMVTREGGSE
jgi:hypothetical protein